MAATRLTCEQARPTGTAHSLTGPPMCPPSRPLQLKRRKSNPVPHTIICLSVTVTHWLQSCPVEFHRGSLTPTPCDSPLNTQICAGKPPPPTSFPLWNQYCQFLTILHRPAAFLCACSSLTYSLLIGIKSWTMLQTWPCQAQGQQTDLQQCLLHSSGPPPRHSLSLS